MTVCFTCKIIIVLPLATSFTQTLVKFLSVSGKSPPKRFTEQLSFLLVVALNCDPHVPLLGVSQMKHSKEEAKVI